MRVALFNLAGRRVRTLLRGESAAGPQSVRWDGRDQRGLDAAPGLYLVRLAALGRVETGRMLRL